MIYSHYPHGFRNGVTLRNIPVDLAINGNANVWWVDSVHGADGNTGKFDDPFATIDYAIGECEANRGDIVYVAAGHTETVTGASGLALDVAGVTVVFLGDGSDRATIRFNTVVTASMTVSAANCTLVNPRFVAGIDALTNPISITGADCTIVNGTWFDGTSIATTDCVIAANTSARLKILGWQYFEGTAGTQKQSNIQLNGVSGALLSDVSISGDFATGNIENVTAAVTNTLLDGIYLKNSNATPKPALVLIATATGMAKNVDLRIASGSTYVSSVAQFNWDNNSLGYNADGGKGTLIGS